MTSVADRSNTERPKKIALRVDGIHDEGVAAAAITPGHLIELVETDDVPRSPSGCQKQSTQGENCGPRFATEDYLQGKTINDAYAEGDLVSFVHCKKGDVVQARVAEGWNEGQALKLQAAGDGTLEELASGTAIAETAETVDFSDTVTYSGEQLVRVRIL